MVLKIYVKITFVPESCKSIIEGNNIDILEIDAASKTSVDDVRELIEFTQI